MINQLKSNLYFAWHSEKRPFLVVLAILSVVMPVAAHGVYRVLADNHARKQINCLAMNIYYESRGESRAGKYAVGMVTMNRVSSDDYPGSVCEVVYQRIWNADKNAYVSAFSWTTQSVDLQVNSRPWQASKQIAQNIYRHALPVDIQPLDALFYHADNVRPYWAKSRERLKKIGRHIFYR